jgi:hypothetical protein
MDTMRKEFEAALAEYVCLKAYEDNGGPCDGMADAARTALDRCLDAMLQAAAAAERSEVLALMRKIRDFSDSEMADGDAARDIAADYIRRRGEG